MIVEENLDGWNNIPVKSKEVIYPQSKDDKPTQLGTGSGQPIQAGHKPQRCYRNFIPGSLHLPEIVPSVGTPLVPEGFFS